MAESRIAKFQNKELARVVHVVAHGSHQQRSLLPDAVAADAVGEAEQAVATVRDLRHVVKVVIGHLPHGRSHLQTHPSWPQTPLFHADSLVHAHCVRQTSISLVRNYSLA